MADDNDIMLTTIDNPWNPFTNYEEWYAYDRAQGYDTPGYLARITRMSFDLSDEDQEQAILNAINEIIQLNIRGIYRTIRRDEEVSVPSGTGGGV
jgi:hypothetical protein